MLNLSIAQMEIKNCPLWRFFYVAESLSGIANNVPGLGAGGAYTYLPRAT